MKRAEGNGFDGGKTQVADKQVQGHLFSKECDCSAKKKRLKSKPAEA